MTASTPRRGTIEVAGAVIVTKRSVTIAGHRTSVSLEDAFWSGLREIAARRGLTTAALAADVDRGRGTANLSSAIRVFVLDNLHRADGLIPGAIDISP